MKSISEVVEGLFDRYEGVIMLPTDLIRHLELEVDYSYRRDFVMTGDSLWVCLWIVRDVLISVKFDSLMTNV